jgi:RND family efflux transporter MFP subunit
MAILRARVLAVVALAAVVAGGLVLLTHGGGKPAAPAAVEVAERGDVAITVGGVGHVSTLSGAARLLVPSSPSTAGAGGGAAGSSAGSGAGSGGSPAPADAVFAALSGHVSRVLVTSGQRVVAGQPVAEISDDGTTQTAVDQARGDLGTARLELAQKQLQDPARGVPPTGPELASGRQALLSARAALAQLLRPPRAADVATAQADVAKARADLDNVRGGTAATLSAAQLAVSSAEQRLATVSGAPDPAELAAARLELAKAALDQETLLRPADGPSPQAVSAANLAVAAAQQHLSDAEASGTAGDVATARADLAKAQSERAALDQLPAPATAAARDAAQLAIDAARQRVEALVHPPAATVAAARGEVARAQADLETARAARGAAAVAAAHTGLTAAQRKLAQLEGPPTSAAVQLARADVRKAGAELAVLRQRGAPASAIDLALARLKVDVADQRLRVAQQLARRLTVSATSSGTVTSLLTVPGAPVDPTTPLLRVQDLDHLVVALDLSEFDVARTRVGAPVRIIATALGGREFGGHVLDVAPSGSEAGGIVNFAVLVRLNSRGRLRPGMSVSTRIIVARRRNVVRIPAAAINGEGAAASVTVRTRTSKSLRRHVRLGLTGSQYVEVRSGLRPGERVVVPEG